MQNPLMMFHQTSTLNTGLRHYWKLDNNTDTVGAASGTDTAMTYGSSYGKIGNGALFGSASYITYSSAYSMFTSNTLARTYSCWFKNTGVVVGPQTLFSGGNQGEFYVRIYNYGDGTLVCDFFPKYNTGYQDFYTSRVNVNTWNNFVLVEDLPNQICTCYLNGISNNILTTSIVGTTRVVANGFSSRIGANIQISATELYHGNIDELGVWERALNLDEVRELYWSGAGNQYPFVG